MSNPWGFRGADGSLVKLGQQPAQSGVNLPLEVTYPLSISDISRNLPHKNYKKKDDQKYNFSGVKFWAETPVIILQNAVILSKQYDDIHGRVANSLDRRAHDVKYFSPSADLVRLIINTQADGAAERCLIDARLKNEISERIVESFADYAYRRQSADELLIDLAQFDVEGNLVWCDNSLARILIFETNVAILHARSFLNTVFSEVVSFLRGGKISGDWGELVNVDRSLKVSVRNSKAL